jgi:hypothetical protein
MNGTITGIRVNTAKYTFIMCCTPRQGDYNLYCHCYKREWLDKHIERAKEGIRFIDSDYNEKFRLADGDKIRITRDNGKQFDRTCQYIDQVHLEVGNNLYHICEFAERMEQAGNTVIPPFLSTG